MIEFDQLFDGEKVSTKHKCPLDNNDQPELDPTEFLDDNNIQKYQSMIGSLQWLVAIGRWDVMTHIMTMASFRS